MGKWTTEYRPARGTLIVIGGKYYPVCDIVKVSELPDIHNAEIAALEEDNDIYRELHDRLAAENVKLRERVAELENEHSAKLAAVLEFLNNQTEALCYCESDPLGMCLTQCQHCEAYARAKAIAEGGE